MDRGRGGNAPRGRGGPAKRGGGGGGGGGSSAQNAQEKPKREAILDLSKYVNTEIKITFQGGRQVTGTLKGFDQLLNLVLDNVEEHSSEVQERSRKLGLAVLRGPTITLISPTDGSEEIQNPFLAQE